MYQWNGTQNERILYETIRELQAQIRDLQHKLNVVATQAFQDAHYDKAEVSLIPWKYMGDPARDYYRNKAAILLEGECYLPPVPEQTTDALEQDMLALFPLAEDELGIGEQEYPKSRITAPLPDLAEISQ